MLLAGLDDVPVNSNQSEVPNRWRTLALPIMLPSPVSSQCQLRQIAKIKEISFLIYLYVFEKTKKQNIFPQII